MCVFKSLLVYILEILNFWKRTCYVCSFVLVKMKMSQQQSMNNFHTHIDSYMTLSMYEERWKVRCLHQLRCILRTNIDSHTKVSICIARLRPPGSVKSTMSHQNRCILRTNIESKAKISISIARLRTPESVNVQTSHQHRCILRTNIDNRRKVSICQTIDRSPESETSISGRAGLLCMRLHISSQGQTALAPCRRQPKVGVSCTLTAYTA